MPAALLARLLLLAFPLTSEALKCYNCENCPEVSALTDTATGCSSCLRISITTSRKVVLRKCAEGKVFCNASTSFLDGEVKVIAANANEGVTPTKWKPYSCCSTGLCNANHRNQPSWSLLLVALIVLVISNSAARYELRDSWIPATTFREE